MVRIPVKKRLRQSVVIGGVLPMLLFFALNVSGGLTVLCGHVRAAIAHETDGHAPCLPGEPCSFAAAISTTGIYVASTEQFFCLYLAPVGCAQATPPLPACPVCDSGGHAGSEYEPLLRPREIRSPAAPAPQQTLFVMVYSRGSTSPLRPVHARPPGFVNTTVLRI